MKTVLTILVTLMAHPAFGLGYEPKPCKAHKQLRQELHSRLIAGIRTTGPQYALVKASSTLPPPKGKTPDTKAAKTIIAGYDEVESITSLPDSNTLIETVAKDALSCWYGPTNLVDKNPKSAWCEGAKGNGVGEVVIVPYQENVPLELRNGFGKSTTTYDHNGRVKNAKVYLLGGGWEPPMGNGPAGLPVLGVHEVTLQDKPEWQQVTTPSWAPPATYNPSRPANWQLKPQKPSYVAIEILSVYPGKRWADTCISEIRSTTP